MDEALMAALAEAEQRAEVAEAEVEDLERRSSLAQDITRHLMRSVAMALAPRGVVLDVPDEAEWPGLIDGVAAMRDRAEAAEAEVAQARAEGRADERAQVVAFCNATAYHGARDAIAAGLHWRRD